MADSNPTYLSDVTIDGTLKVTGALTQQGAVTASGGLNVTSTMTLGTNGFSFVGLRSSTVSVALGTVASDSVSTSVTVTGVAAGDPILAIAPASQWSGAYYDIDLSALATGTNTVVLQARNSTTTGINTTAQNMTFYWLDLA